MPRYTGSNVQERSPLAEQEAVLSLLQLEQLLVRYIVDRYNQRIDGRMKHQSRIGRWEAGLIGQLPLVGKRELDICLMRRERRTVYRSGYIQFANLTYQGEHLAGYAGERVIVRYDPRDITTIWIYQLRNGKEEFLTRAHAQGLETEMLCYGEAQAMSWRLRSAGKAISNPSVLNEVRDRDAKLEQLRREHRQQKGRISRRQVKQSVTDRIEERERGLAQPGVEEEIEEQKQEENETEVSTTVNQLTVASDQSVVETIKEGEMTNRSGASNTKRKIRVYANYEEIAEEARRR